ncbi:hypothetical protein PQR64_35825 [Paraburkholderia phytofirmans]|uniref:hypothetical protein n=1 Tax=Paraburkholderia TaxID=1822464 RepID=UPI0038B86938
MQNAPLFHVLLDHLETIDTPPMEVQRFVNHWSKLTPHGHLPCPVCFLNREEQPLVPLGARANLEPVICKACGTRYEVPIDDR